MASAAVVNWAQEKLDEKTVIITGANTGIGLETAVDLAKRNARVILACRNVERGERAAIEVKERSRNDNVVFIQVDLASLDSVRDFAVKILRDEPRIDILINNAGVLNNTYIKSADGFELTFSINHLGHFLLTNLLLERIKEAPSARIVNVSSEMYRFWQIDFNDLNSERSYGGRRAYGRSKMANILFTRRLAKELQGTGVTVNALHPGAIYTNIFRQNLSFGWKVIINLFRPCFFTTAEQGAQTTIYCAVSQEMEGVTGQYLADCRIKTLRNPQAADDEAADKLWEMSMEMVGMKS